MNIKQETFEAVKELLEDKKRVHYSPDDLGGDIGTHYYELDPAYAPLLVLFREECLSCLYHRGDVDVRCNCDCKDAWRSRFPYWQEAPEGALAGAISQVVVVWDFGKISETHGVNKNVDQLALEVLEKWLKVEV